MNNDLSLLVSGNDDGNSYVQVPIKKKDFGDFITNLLGQPEKIRDSKSGTYEINFEWLIHIHHLLDQRINQQNYAELVDFSAVFKFESGTERKITTIGGFLNFNEAKMVCTKSVEITWTYLVNFPNKAAPEKQEITLELITELAEVVTVGRSSVIRNAISGKGIISYVISHTERTWGDDIQGLLSNEIENVIDKEPWYLKLVFITSILLMMGFFAAGLLVPEYIEQLIREQQLTALYASFVPDGMTILDLDMNEKLNLALKLLDPNNNIQNVDVWFRIMSFIAGFALSIFTVIFFERNQKSFIVVTVNDRVRRDKYLAKKKSSFTLKLLSFIGAVFAGVAGNYLYYYINLP
ncbi:hypothetical protein HR45_02965 [Shewanella mangrovi]|uniref:Uncharacterized protein n=1 Tax=Shewanella mangrovi TaxID=1515746 RepID=A0A094LTB0_9GAMM|nr:hypothetical protein [Shewanella mangrovi]KFZ38423.1 hypothetical protein HR45_02965 [Shewanella mangrovi]